MFGKMLKWIGVDWWQAGGSKSVQAVVAVQSAARRPRPGAWCVVVSVDQGLGFRLYRTRSTTCLVDALILTHRLRMALFFAYLQPASLVKNVPLLPDAVVAKSLPGPMAWIDAMYRRVEVN